MRKLVGLVVMGGSGFLILYGGLTGRLAAILAAVAKPEDLGPSGSGAPAPGSQEAVTMQGDQLLTALEQQARAEGLNSIPGWKKAFDSTVKPLIAKALASGNQADYDAAARALQTLNAQYRSKQQGATAGRVTKGTPKTPKAISGPLLGGKPRAPIVAPLTGGKA